MLGNIGGEYVEKWRRFEELSALQTLSARFQAGRIFGEVLMEVVAVIGAGATAVKAASKIPRLAKLARLRRAGAISEVKAPSVGPYTTPSQLRGSETIPHDRVPVNTELTAALSSPSTATPYQSAQSAAQAARLSRQLSAEEIANGHAFTKHVVEGQELPHIGTPKQFAELIEDVMENATHVRQLSGGRSAYWRDGIVVIRSPKAIDGGTAFVPATGFSYFEGLK